MKKIPYREPRISIFYITEIKVAVLRQDSKLHSCCIRPFLTGNKEKD